FRQGAVTAFYEQWSTAAELAPWTPYYDFEIGVQLSQFVDRLNQRELPNEPSRTEEQIQTEREQREKLLTQAAEHLQVAASIVNTDELLNRYAGSLLVELSPEQGIVYLRRAAQLTPRKAYTYAMMGFAHAEVDPEDPLMVGSLAIEGYINPGFLLAEVWRRPAYEPQWLATIEQTLALYEQCLERVPDDEPGHRTVYRNYVGLQWVLAQIQQQPMEWSTVDLDRLAPIWRAIALIDAGEPQDAIALLDEQTSSAALLLKAWIDPERYLPQPGADLSAFGALGHRIEQLSQATRERRLLLNWLVSLHDTARAESSRIGFFSYRNMNGPDAIKFPYPLPINILVRELGLFESVRYLPDFDRVLVQAQADLLQLQRPLS
ncbi:MAG: hypothetical protein AAGF24_16625, partial [Cyanobacteria bacterium P01_H01_bin.121]